MIDALRSSREARAAADADARSETFASARVESATARRGHPTPIARASASTRTFAGGACSAFGGNSQDAANTAADAAASDEGNGGGDAADARPCPACNSGYCTIAGKCAPLVFVTAEHHDGNLGGASGADEMCARAATDAGLTNATSFLAWVTTDPSVSARIVLVERPYRRVNGGRT